jgi:hypothetical protein
MGERHVLAEKQTAGFGGANGDVADRLVAVVFPDRPSMTLIHERDYHPDPLEDGDTVHTQEWEKLRVTPMGESDGKIEPGRDFNDRVRVTRNNHSPRTYIRHERREGGEWTVRNEWEIHPATGLQSTQEVVER